jgi:hypothetical protein
LLKALEEKGLSEEIVRVGLRAAMEGDFRFWKEIFDRVDGKIVDKVQVEEKRVIVERRDRSAGDPGKPASDAGEGQGGGQPV